MGNSPTSLEEIRNGFFQECEELLEQLTDALGDPDFAAPGNEAVHKAFRAVHSIKGGAASFGIGNLADFAHDFESELDRLRTAPGGRGQIDLSALMRTTDQLSRIVEDCRLGLGRPDRPRDRSMVTAPDTSDFSGGDGLKANHWVVDFVPTEALFTSGNEPLHILNALSELGEAQVHCDMTTLPGLAKLSPENGYLNFRIRLPGDVPERSIRDCFDFVEDICKLSISREETTSAQEPTIATDDAALQTVATTIDTPTVRVGLDRIDRLLNLVGELVIAQSMLEQCMRDGGTVRHTPARIALDDLAGLTDEIQTAVMAIRAQPVKPLFQRMSRILREAAASSGKRVELTAIGDGTEVDRAIIERLTDPLTHMIRNAVDHGIEAPAIRAANGKPETGTVTLSAAHRSDRIIIELQDDGAGIDRTKVRQIAQARGLVAPDRILSDGEIDELLFLPGFSTASQVTSLSGRGVGLDVVRSALKRLGGRFSIQSTPGIGTRFTISLPLTLAVMEAMTLQSGSHIFVLPLAVILETVAISTVDLREIGAGRRMIRMRNHFVPLCDVATVLGLQTTPRGEGTGVAVLVSDDEDALCALLFDDILDQRQVVVKGLRGNCGTVPGVAAATILGDGRVALILDPADIMRLEAEPQIERLVG